VSDLCVSCSSSSFLEFFWFTITDLKVDSSGFMCEESWCWLILHFYGFCKFFLTKFIGPRLSFLSIFGSAGFTSIEFSCTNFKKSSLFIRSTDEPWLSSTKQILLSSATSSSIKLSQNYLLVSKTSSKPLQLLFKLF